MDEKYIGWRHGGEGRNIIVSEVVIVEVSRLPVEGTRWIDKHVLMQDAIAYSKT